MGLLGYYWRVLRIAFTHSFGLAQDILFAIFIIGGMALYLLKRGGMIADTAPWMTEITGWQIAAVVSVTIILIRLLLAPYWLHLEATRNVIEERKRISDNAVTKPAEKPINWAIWKQHSYYDLPVFAAILAGISPNSRNDDSAGILNLLKEDASKGKLLIVEGEYADFLSRVDREPSDFRVERESALAWAKARGFDVSHIE